MKYVVLLYQDESIWADLADTERRSTSTSTSGSPSSPPSSGITVIAGEGLCDVSTATTVRRAVTTSRSPTGPFAETAEQFGGFYLVDAPSLDEVLEAARVLPEYTIEIRPVADL